MEARVDIRKLQLLNDRITQTIDALNQVRWSVHGLQHATGGVPNQGAYGAMQPPLPFAGQSPYAQGMYAQNVQGQQPYGALQQGLSPWQQQAFAQQPYATSSYATQGPGQPFATHAPYATPGIGMQHTTATPYGVPVMGYGAQMPIDIEQRILEARVSDPYLLSRTFPQAFVPTMGW